MLRPTAAESDYWQSGAETAAYAASSFLNRFTSTAWQTDEVTRMTRWETIKPGVGNASHALNIGADQRLPSVPTEEKVHQVGAGGHGGSSPPARG